MQKAVARFFHHGRVGMCFVVALGGAVAAAWGQVDIHWSLLNSRTLLMEPIKAEIRISNYTGRMMDFSQETGNARLSFAIEADESDRVATSGRPLLPGPVLIPPGETRDLNVDLLQAYRVVRGQSYMIMPEIRFEGMRFSGQRLALEVQPGLEILKRTYGLPADGTARTVSLRVIHRDRFDHLFFRLDNPATGFCLAAVDLGGLIRFIPPTLELDANGVFHVLHQSIPERFSHARFDFNGKSLGTDFYLAVSGAICMKRNEAGEVEVTGGTLFEPDAAAPGHLTAPSLPPSHPYPTTLGAPSPDDGTRK